MASTPVIMEILGLISCALVTGGFLCSSNYRYREGCVDYTAAGLKAVCTGLSSYCCCCCCCCCGTRTVEQDLEGIDASIPMRTDLTSYGSLVHSQTAAIKDDSSAPKKQATRPCLLALSPTTSLLKYTEYTVLENINHDGPEVLSKDQVMQRQSLLQSMSNDYGEFAILSSDDAERLEQPEANVEEEKPSSNSSLAASLFALFPLKSKSVRNDPVLEPEDADEPGELSPLQSIRDMSMTGTSKAHKRVCFDGEVNIAEVRYFPKSRLPFERQNS